MAFQDQTLKCQDCGKDFVWTAAEQEFYAQKGFQNAPLRCPECRAKRKADRIAQRTMYKAVCADCGKECEVPFQPKQDRPVYCSECYKKHRNA